MENGELEISPKQTSEKLRNQHFEYVLVMGQGPVQEAEKIPQSGREGLNFYSRLIALSAAVMLEKGITDKVILSGGATGSRKGTPEAKTEAELMADIIRTKLTRQSDNKQSYLVGGRTMPKYDERGNHRPEEDISRDIHEALNDIILIENEARYTLENFTLTLNKYIDVDTDVSNVPGNNQREKARIGILGIGFHAYDLHSRAGVGRLQALADIFAVNGPVFSAEDVIRELIINEHGPDAHVSKQLLSLLDVSENDLVTKLKSELEYYYVQGLRQGDWVQVVKSLKNPMRIRTMLANDPYVRRAFKEQLGVTKDDIEQMDIQELLAKLDLLKVQGCPDYSGVKRRVAEILFSRSRETKVNYYGKYFEDKTLRDLE